MREKDIEMYLREEVKKLGGRAYKFESPGNAGVPDRLITLPYGLSCFVEVKAPGKQPAALQSQQLAFLRNLKQAVFVVDSKEAVRDLIGEMKEWLHIEDPHTV